MANWDEFVSCAKKTFNKAALKVNDAADCAADTVKIEAVRIQLCERYEQLGRMLYADMKAGTADKEKINEKIAEIDAFIEKMAMLKERRSQRCSKSETTEGPAPEAAEELASEE